MEPLAAADGTALFDIAARSICNGLTGGGPLLPTPAELPPRLRQHQGAFVTLLVDDELNGCIGTLYADQPLGMAVGRRAWDAAFADPRLPALQPSDYARLEVEISVLSELEPVPARTEDELLTALRPGVDGLLIDAGALHATFLPVMWTQLPEPTVFLRQLKQKAGLPFGSWPAGLTASRYTARSFHRAAATCDPGVLGVRR
jgi:hypothetical protein